MPTDSFYPQPSFSSSRAGIYVITCQINGHCYVGRSTDIPKRWVRHRYELAHGVHINRHLQAAWNKYGAEVFVFSVLESTKPDDALLSVREAYWCVQLQPRYNIKPVGGTTFGYTLSAVTRAKISAAAKGNTRWLGKHHQPETLNKMRESALRRTRAPFSEQARANMRAAAVNRPPRPRHTLEAKAKISAAAMGNTRCLGRVLSTETKAKISAARTGQALSAETKAKISAIKRGVSFTPEHRAKIAAARKAYWARWRETST